MEVPGLGGCLPGELGELRLACEECHKRKIRCRHAGGNSRGTCEACWENKRSCVFSIKAKTGRPRKAGGTKISMRHAGQNRRDCFDDATSSNFLNDTSSGSSTSLSNTIQTLPRMSSQMAAYFSLELGMESSFFTPSQHHHASAEDDLNINHDLTPHNDDMSSDSLLSILPYSSSFDSQSLSDSAIDHNMGNCFYDMLQTEMSDPTATTGAVATISTDFVDVMQICNEINGWSQNCSLSLCAEAHQPKILSMLGTIDKLSRRVLLLSPAKQGSVQPRKEQYSSTILKAAVEEAVEIAADLVSFNEQRTAARPPQLETMLLLCRLDHCLFNFGTFIAGHSSLDGMEGGRQGRTEQVRNQTWRFIEKLRGEWA